MACLDQNEALALLEGLLPAERAAQVEAHLADCDACRRLVAVAVQTGVLTERETAGDGGSEAVPSPGGEESEGVPSPGSEEPEAFLPGTQVDHFRIMRLLGRGGMGEVYLARDMELGRKVALKVMRPAAFGSPEAMARFHREARITARFNHPHIVVIHAVGEHRGRPYVALEYLEGQSLRRRLASERPGMQEVLRIGLAVARALQEAHRRGVLHRDLKPDNVMLPRDGRLRVLDFGLAKVLTEEDLHAAPAPGAPPDDLPLAETFTSAVLGGRQFCGTPAYMAPEQWCLQGFTPASDIWGLGLLLHELAAGRLPVNEPDAVAQSREICRPEEIPRLEDPGVPAGLAALIADCLSKEPGQRPAASGVVRRLQEIEVEARVHPRPEANPFRGLLPFREEHHLLFFGREEEIATAVERLRQEPMLTLVGSSGAGKSSFVEAGIIPRLGERGPLLVLRLRPGREPFLALAAQVAAARRDTRAASEMEEIRRLGGQLRDAPATLNVVLQQLAEQRGASVLVVVDQLEELFTLVPDEELQGGFLQAVLCAADEPQGPVRALLALREEFLGRLAAAGGAEALVHVMVLRRPGPQRLARILARTVEAAGYTFDDPALVQEMVAEVQHEASCLPLLQFAGQQLWEHRDRTEQVLCRSAHEDMGGVAGALARHADGVLEELSVEERRLARELLLRLVTAQGTRRLQSRAQLLDGLGHGASGVLARLTEARLLVVRRPGHAEEAGGDPAAEDSAAEVELVHESLVVAWGRLARWLAESREELRLLQEIDRAAELWEQRGRRGEEVWQGGTLRDALRVLEGITSGVPPRVLRFIEAGRHREERSTRRRRGLIISGFVVLTLVALVLALQTREANHQRAVAEQRRAEAEHRQAEIQREGARAAFVHGDLLKARAKLRSALEREDSAAARILFWRLSKKPMVWQWEPGKAIWKLAFSPDGRNVAVASTDPQIYLVDARNRQIRRVLRGHRDQIYAVDYAPDGVHLVSGGKDGEVLLWDTRERQSARVLQGQGDVVWDVAYSPDGRHLASASEDGRVRLWDVSKGGGPRVLEGHQGPVMDVDFSADGKTLATGSNDRTVRLWDVATGSMQRVMEGFGSGINNVGFDPRGRFVAAVGSGGIAELRDAGTGRPAGVLAGHRQTVWSVAFSPDGRFLATGSSDQTVRLWDTASQRHLASFTELTGYVRGVRFSPDGRFLGAGSNRGHLGLWEIATAVAERPPTEAGHSFNVYGVAFSPDGRLLASSGVDTTVRLWEVATGRQVRVLSGHRESVPSVVFSSDGRLLASASVDKTVRIWEVRTGRQVRVIEGGEGWMALSPDGRYLAVAGKDPRIRLFEVQTGRVVRVLQGHTGPVNHVCFSPDGKTLATGSNDRTVRLWSVSTGEQVRVLARLPFVVFSLDFSPGGGYLAAGSRRTVSLLDLASGQSRELGKCPKWVYKLAFHPDGRRVGAACADSTARIWDLTGDGETVLRGHRREVNAVAFSPDGALAATVSDDRTVRLWDLRQARPRWNGIALLAAESGGAELYSTGGWRRIGGPARSTAPGSSAWRRGVEQRARYAVREDDSGLLCIATHDNRLELWDTSRDRRLVDRRVPRLARVLATPGGCVTLTDGGVAAFHPEAGPSEVMLRGEATAVARHGERVLVAAGRQILAFDRAGKRRGRALQADIGVTALLAAGDGIYVGYADGNVERVSPASGARQPGLALQDVVASPVERMLALPMGLLVLGHASGALGIWDARTGERLHLAHLHGPVVHLLSRGRRLYAATELGDHLTWDLGVLHLQRCELLEAVWKRIPVVWDGGLPVVRAPPAGHPCRAGGQ
jgi:WD40 repeat protein/serine/threonine protein kinase